MHSRIFQLSASPIDKENYIVESDYYDHWFTNQIADYVDGDCNRDESIGWLYSYSKAYDVSKCNDGNYRLVVHNKEIYFENAYKSFVEEVNKLTDMSLEQFTNGFNLYGLTNAYEDKFGFYVDLYGDGHGNELMTLDAFIRRCNVGTVYYIGGVIDYHF